MEKLYRRVGEAVHYQEAWVDGGLLYHHWGVIGERGKHTTRPLRMLERRKSAIRHALAEARRDGYKPMDLDDHATLIIEFRVDGFGSDGDLDRRHALQERIDDLLGWTGIGHCDGGSAGGDTMEVCCYVVDFDIAKQLIERDLVGSQFSDYSRVYREEDL